MAIDNNANAYSGNIGFADWALNENLKSHNKVLQDAYEDHRMSDDELRRVANSLDTIRLDLKIKSNGNDAVGESIDTIRDALKAFADAQTTLDGNVAVRTANNALLNLADVYKSGGISGDLPELHTYIANLYEVILAAVYTPVE